MNFEKPLDYVEALQKLEGFPLMGTEVRDGRLVWPASPFSGGFSTRRWIESMIKATNCLS